MTSHMVIDASDFSLYGICLLLDAGLFEMQNLIRKLHGLEPGTLFPGVGLQVFATLKSTLVKIDLHVRR